MIILVVLFIICLILVAIFDIFKYLIKLAFKSLMLTILVCLWLYIYQLVYRSYNTYSIQYSYNI